MLQKARRCCKGVTRPPTREEKEWTSHLPKCCNALGKQRISGCIALELMQGPVRLRSKPWLDNARLSKYEQICFLGSRCPVEELHHCVCKIMPDWTVLHSRLHQLNMHYFKADISQLEWLHWISSLCMHHCNLSRAAVLVFLSGILFQTLHLHVRQMKLSLMIHKIQLQIKARFACTTALQTVVSSPSFFSL